VNAVAADGSTDVTASEIFVDEDPEFIEDMANGLGSFKVLGKYDILSSDVEFIWNTEGYHFGEDGVYQLWKSTRPGEWEIVGSFDEIGDRLTAYYYPEFDVVVSALEKEEDLMFGGYCGFVLITYDLNESSSAAKPLCVGIASLHGCQDQRQLVLDILCGSEEILEIDLSADRQHVHDLIEALEVHEDDEDDSENGDEDIELRVGALPGV